MKKRIFHFLILVLITTACQPPQVGHDLLITNVNIIDVKTGEVLTHRSIGIDGDQISAIYETEVSLSEDGQSLDGKGGYIIPGLWDMHAHYFWNYTSSNPLLVANGITGIREMWGNMGMIDAARASIAKGEMLGPDIYSAGVIIDGVPPIWPGSAGVANAEEAMAEVDKQIATGVDFLKVYSRLNKESFMAIANRANEKGIPFAGHIPPSISIWEAIASGMQSSEHMYGILESSNSEQELLASQPSSFSQKSMEIMIDNFDEALFDSLATVLAESNHWISPTLTVLRSIAHLDDTTFTNDQRMEYLPAFMTGNWNPKNDFRFKDRKPEFYEVSKAKYKKQLSLMGKLANKGVKIIAGTDYPNPYCFPGFSLHDELELMVEGGMSSLQALQAATLNAALFQGKENEMGTVETGKLASLVLLSANPLEDINQTRQIETVILRGKTHDRASLDAMLAGAKEAANPGSNN